MKMFITAVSIFTIFFTHALFANEFAHVGRWSIVRGNAACAASTVVNGTLLEFALAPTPVLAIENPRWRIPAGRYKVGLTYLGDKDTERDMTVPSHVYSQQPNRIVIQWERAGDVAALVSVGWLQFHVGPHDFTFPSDASDVAELLPRCAKARR